MIILYEENETDFQTLGYGVLKDAITCVVKEELNGSFELEMIYPVDGSHYKDISLRSIIYVKPNRYSTPQPFRIYKISMPIDGRVTINAEHISYDLSGYVIEPFTEKAIGIQDAFNKITSNVLGSFPFTFETDITNAESEFNIQVPATVRSILAGREGSLLDVFKGEYSFDKYRIILNKNRGIDRGFSIIYGKNLTDLTREIASEKLYTDVYPYFYRIVTETSTTTSKVYQKVYVRTAKPGEEPIIPFSKDWLSLNPDSAAFTPLIKDTPVQINSEGEYFEKIYIWTDVEEEGETKTKYVEVSSEDYPPNIPSTESTTTEQTEMTTLDNKTIPIEGRENVSPKRILHLDLTQSFSDKPTSEELEEKAKDYIKNNKIGEVTETVEASFLKIFDDSINEAQCMLGDTVTIIYKKLGVKAEIKVISTEYDVLLNKYNNIGLGKKESTLSDTSLSIGDDISSLNNDAGYTDELKVTELITKTITADYIQATNVEFSTAQIETLTSDNFIANGLIQAAEGSIDTLVAGLLTADDAEIKNTLTAGTIEVTGTINVISGSITIENETSGTTFEVDQDGNLYANSVEIEGSITATSGIIGGCIIDGDGTLHVGAANVDSINIGGTEQNPNFSVDTFGNVYISTGSMHLGSNIAPQGQPENYPFEVDSNGHLSATGATISGDIDITSGSISISNQTAGTSFSVDANGNVVANSVTLEGTITATSGTIGGCVINDERGLIVETTHIDGTITANAISLGGTEQNPNFSVDTSGDVYISTGEINLGNGIFVVDTNGNVTIKEGSITLGGTEQNPNFSVDTDGNVSISTGEINLGAILNEQEQPTGEYYFSIDNTGNLTIKKGSIDLGDGSFRVTEDGGLTADSIQITKGELLDLSYIESNTAIISDIQVIKSDTDGFIYTSILNTPYFPDGLNLGDSIISQTVDADSYTTETRSFTLTVLTSNFDEKNGTTTITYDFIDNNHTNNDFGTINMQLGGGCTFQNLYHHPGGAVIQRNFQKQLPRTSVSYDATNGHYSITQIQNGYVTASEIISGSIFINVYPSTFQVNVKSSDPKIYIDMDKPLLVPSLGTSDYPIDNIYVDNVNAENVNCNAFTLNSRKQPYFIYATKITIPQNSSRRITYSTIRQELGGADITSSDFISASVVKDYDSNGNHYRYENPEVRVTGFGIDIYSMDNSGSTDYFVTLIFSND